MVSMHLAESDRNAEPELRETFYTWKKVTAAVLHTQQGHGMVHSDLKLHRLWKREICLVLVSVCLCRARCLGALDERINV